MNIGSCPKCGRIMCIRATGTNEPSRVECSVCHFHHVEHPAQLEINRQFAEQQVRQKAREETLKNATTPAEIMLQQPPNRWDKGLEELQKEVKSLRGELAALRNEVHQQRRKGN